MKTNRILLTVAAALAAFVLGACLVACDGGGNGGGNGGGQTPTPTPVPSQTPSGTDPASDPTPATSPTKAVTVTDLFRFQGTYKDPNGYDIHYSYVLPKVDGPDTDYIYDINAKVAAMNDDYVQPAIKDMEKGRSLGWGKVEYVSGTAGSITTIMMTWSNAYDNIPLYATWIIGPDGRQAEASELFAAKGVTSDQVLEKVRELLGELATNDYDAIEQALGKEFADETRECDEKTMSDANINTHMPYYINEDGHLAVVAIHYVVAGGGLKVYFFDLGF